LVKRIWSCIYFSTVCVDDVKHWSSEECVAADIINVFGYGFMDLFSKGYNGIVL
jgi:hypothetical protein